MLDGRTEGIEIVSEAIVVFLAFNFRVLSRNFGFAADWENILGRGRGRVHYFC